MQLIILHLAVLGIFMYFKNLLLKEQKYQLYLLYSCIVDFSMCQIMHNSLYLLMFLTLTQLLTFFNKQNGFGFISIALMLLLYLMYIDILY